MLPIEGAGAEAILAEHDFFARDVVPDGVYEGVGETTTLSVPALWVVGAGVEESLLYDITRALWHDSRQEFLQRGHMKGCDVTLETALNGVGIPLHPGAERYDKEIGRIE